MSSSISRRSFLKWSAAGAGAAMASSLLLRRAHSAPFGEFPAAYASKLLPADVRATNVLEIFLYGGLSPWETLYLVEEYGRPTDPMFANQQFYTFGPSGGDSVSAALTACSFPAGEPMGVSFARDALGADVKLGPFAYALRQRTDVTDRMRMTVCAHELEPHEAAIPLGLTGKRVGSPTLAGLGAHIQRFSYERAPDSRKSPFSYVLATGAIPGDNIFSAVATGAHPGLARPLRIKVDAADQLGALLARGTVGSAAERAQYDAAMRAYLDQYRSRLAWKGQGAPLRSHALTDVGAGVNAVANADAVAGVMDQSLFVPVSGTVCGDESTPNVPGMSLKVAAHLLTHPTEPARYVCVVDTGLIQASGGGGYDTHTENSHDTARNFKNLMESLLGIVNKPGENDPKKLDLDKTLIVLNTEFGRTPTVQPGSNGRNHHPYGYVTAMIGGPIRKDQRGIFGAIGPDGVATQAIAPAEHRIAALLALGIYPYSPDSFSVSDVKGTVDEQHGLESVTARVLGYTV